MAFKKFIIFLITLLEKFVKTHREANQTYKKQIASSNGDKSKINNAKIAFTIVIVANLIARIVLPIGLVALLIWALVYYFIPILAVTTMIYLVYAHISEIKQKEVTHQQQVSQAEYKYIAELVFNPFRELEAWLPVKQPQSIYGIFCAPYWTVNNGVKIFTFSLLKTGPEKVEDEQLLYSQKMLDHMLQAKLQKMQQEDLHGVYFYNDAPCLVVNEIEDKGEKIIITILVVDNQQAFNYYKHKITTHHQQSQKSQIQPFDEDF